MARKTNIKDSSNNGLMQAVVIVKGHAILEVVMILQPTPELVAETLTRQRIEYMGLPPELPMELVTAAYHQSLEKGSDLVIESCGTITREAIPEEAKR